MFFRQMRPILVVAAVLAVGSREGAAASVTATAFASYDSFASFTMDPATGKYYERPGFSAGPAVSVFDSAAALASGTPSGTLTLQDGGFYGTYFSVLDGHLYG